MLTLISRAKILEFTRAILSTVLLSMMVVSVNYAQQPNSINLLEFKYGFHVPLADMKDRFGANSDIGINFISVNARKNLFIGVDGIFLFGSIIKEDVLAELRAFDGNIISRDGTPGDINLKERGFYIGLNAGKFFKTSKTEYNLTGFRAQIGGGLLQHKIRVQDNLNNIPSLKKDLLPGYDRLSNGPAFHLGLGYQYQSKKNNFHFNVMGDMYGAKTVSRRDFDSATGGYLDDKRTDILAGITVSYIVMISRSTRAENIYY